MVELRVAGRQGEREGGNRRLTSPRALPPQYNCHSMVLLRWVAVARLGVRGLAPGDGVTVVGRVQGGTPTVGGGNNREMLLICVPFFGWGSAADGLTAFAMHWLSWISYLFLPTAECATFAYVCSALPEPPPGPFSPPGRAGTFLCPSTFVGPSGMTRVVMRVGGREEDCVCFIAVAELARLTSPASEYFLIQWIEVIPEVGLF